MISTFEADVFIACMMHIYTWRTETRVPQLMGIPHCQKPMSDGVRQAAGHASIPSVSEKKKSRNVHAQSFEAAETRENEPIHKTCTAQPRTLTRVLPAWTQ